MHLKQTRSNLWSSSPGPWGSSQPCCPALFLTRCCCSASVLICCLLLLKFWCLQTCLPVLLCSIYPYSLQDSYSSHSPYSDIKPPSSLAIFSIIQDLGPHKALAANLSSLSPFVAVMCLQSWICSQNGIEFGFLQVKSISCPNLNDFTPWAFISFSLKQ